MFGRTKQPVGPVVDDRLPKTGGKNRPTPRRATAQAANRRPLVASGGRGGARRTGSTAVSRTGRDARRAAQLGRLAGEERYLPARDRGPVKAYVRDVVDSRHNLGEHFLVYILVLFVLQLVLTRINGSVLVLAVTYALLWGGLIAVVVDSLLLRRRVRAGVAARFGAPAVQRGVVSYAVMRAVQMRRSRIPRPAVARGRAPR